MAAHLSSEGPLSDYKLPEYRYYPRKLLPAGTRDWSRVRFLQACERLGVPENRWPAFDNLTLPAKGVKFLMRSEPFFAPRFDILHDSETGWRKTAEVEFRKHCDAFLKRVRQKINEGVSTGVLTRIEQPKEKTGSLDLRYEWAARRFCYNEAYKDMATDEHGPDKIRKVVARIFAEIQIQGFKRRK